MLRVLLALGIIGVNSLVAAHHSQPFQQPLVFEPNHGQAPADVKWIARASGYRLMVTAQGATIVFSEPATETKPPASPQFGPTARLATESRSTYSAVQMRLTDGRQWAGVNGLEPTGGVSNYLLGGDPKRWHTNVPHYGRLKAAQVYDGIDLVFYSNKGELEYDFEVAPGADPKQIRLAFDGVEHMKMDNKTGDLLLTTAGGAELRQMRPKVYQQIGGQRVEVASGYDILDRHKATFTLASYDRHRPLVIDPVFKFAAYVAGNGKERAEDVAVDSSGNVYLTGRTESTNLSTPNALQGDQPLADAFVTKLSPTGAVLFTTYLGGDGIDEGWGIAVDATGIYVAGKTSSTNFPIKNALFQHRLDDGFVTKLTRNGTALIYSTYLGGSGYDEASGIVVDSAGGALVAGSTTSADFPIAGGPSAGQQRKHGGLWDGFIARMAPDGLSIAFSTFVGGKSYDNIYDIALDRTGSVYATGSGSSGFPITSGARPCGVQDAVVIRLKGRGTQMPYATCLGPAIGTGIAVDTKFNAYVIGYTYGGFPTTGGAYQPTKPVPEPNAYSAFVTKLGASGAVAYSTYFGASDGITSGEAIGVDSSGAAYIGGTLRATTFPGAPTLPNNQYLGYISRLTPQGNGLSYTMILNTGISAISVLENPRRLYLAGRLGDSASDAFVMKFE